MQPKICAIFFQEITTNFHSFFEPLKAEQKKKKEIKQITKSSFMCFGFIKLLKIAVLKQ